MTFLLNFNEQFQYTLSHDDDGDVDGVIGGQGNGELAAWPEGHWYLVIRDGLGGSFPVVVTVPPLLGAMVFPTVCDAYRPYLGEILHAADGLTVQATDTGWDRV